MAEFDYVMMLVSIIIGLALTHILSNLAQAIPAMAKKEQALRPHPAFAFWCGYVFTYLISFWWFEYEWSTLNVVWDFKLYLS